MESQKQHKFIITSKEETKTINLIGREFTSILNRELSKKENEKSSALIAVGVIVGVIELCAINLGCTIDDLLFSIHNTIEVHALLEKETLN